MPYGLASTETEDTSMHRISERRQFLRAAGSALLAAPLAVSLPQAIAAETTREPGVKTDNPEADKGRDWPASLPGVPSLRLDVLQLGAKGDGQANDTLALQQTIDRCAMLGGGHVEVPAGNYLCGALVLRSHVWLELAAGATIHGVPDLASYPLSQVRWEGKFIPGHTALISAIDAENIAIQGPGAIAGSEAIQGRVDLQTGYRLPALLEFSGCRQVRVEDCQTSNGGMWSIHPLYCEQIAFRRLKIASGADGIDVDSCRQVVIEDCEFDTVDDCISLKSGRGEEGYTIGRPTEEVRIANCSFLDRHFACIGIGSETSAGIRQVRIENCRCQGARSHAIYIKSRPGRGAYLEDIAVDGFEATGARQGFLRLNTLNSGKHDQDPVPGLEGIPSARNFRFENIRVYDLPSLVEGWEIHPQKALDGFVMRHVTGTVKSGITLAHVRHAELDDIAVTGFEGPLVQIFDVTGTGLAGAASLDMSHDPAAPGEEPAPATPYQLH